MGRAPCCEKVGLKKGRWTADEDRILTEYIKAHGEGSWRSLPKNAGLLRCGKSCRLRWVNYLREDLKRGNISAEEEQTILKLQSTLGNRWVNYLREDLKRGNISAEEEQTILKLQSTLGNRWSIIAGHLPGRTDNEIKNYWNAHLSKKVATAGTAAGEGVCGGGESGVREEEDDGDDHDDDDDGEVCSEDNGSTVVDADRDDVEDAADDSVDSLDVSSRANGKAGGNKREGSVGSEEESVVKRKKKANKRRESSQDQPEEPIKEENEENNNNNIKKKKKKNNNNSTDKKDDDNDAADGSRKRKNTCGGTDSCCDHVCGSTKKKQKKEKKKQVHASSVTQGESGSKEDVSNDNTTNKSQKKRRKVAKPANLPSTETEPSSKQPVEEQAPRRPPSKPKPKAKAKAAKLEPKAEQEPDAGASTGAGAACCNAMCGAEQEMGPLAHVEHMVESADGGLLLEEAPCHLEYTGMGVDLLQAIESDGGGLMLPGSGGSMVSNDDLLLDYLDMSCTDGACCTTGGLTPHPPSPCEDVHSLASGWPDSPPMTLPPPSMLGDEEAMFTSMGSFSTSSSCIDLVDLHLCADACGNNTNAGPAVVDNIGSLPWEAEEDFWRLLSEFAGDMDAAGPAQQEELEEQEEKAPPCMSLNQPVTMMTQGLHSNSTAGCRADDVLADDGLENSWLLADTFLS